MTANLVALNAQRMVTAAFIADDPTTAALIPVTKIKKTNGGFEEQSQTPRDSQTFKLVLLAFDQRPTITVAGVERVIDYHLVGPHDMAIAVGDYWLDTEETRYEVAGISEGWEYEIKAFVFRHIPREAKP